MGCAHGPQCGQRSCEQAESGPNAVHARPRPVAGVAVWGLRTCNVRMYRSICIALFGTLLLSTLHARVVSVEVASRESVLGGQPFGLAGPYERITGTIRFAADPDNTANKIITDIALAPRNADGEVEYSSEFFLLRPQDPSRGNGALLYEVSNRGRKGMLGFFNGAAGSLDPSEKRHFGDGFLLQQGFTLLWLGWQFDPPRSPGLIRLTTPVATRDGAAIRGLVRSDFVVKDRLVAHSLADRNHIPYRVADPQAAENRMTVRDAANGKRQPIPRERWRFARMEEGKPVPDGGSVYLEGGFEPGRIYEVVYVSEDPPLVGLGPAAVRDAVSQLKYEGEPSLGIAVDAIDRAIAFGISQSGRFLRTFLYYGFNQDEKGRIAFDGIMSHVAGGGRGSFNHRFAQPSRDAHPYLNFVYPTDIYPFTDVAQRDPETGREDGILTHALDRKFWPKIFYTNSSYEYWGRAASLIHTDLEGAKDIGLLDNVRVFLFAGTQHGPAGFPPSVSIGQQKANPLTFRWPMRALLLAMSEWSAGRGSPPASRYPLLADKSLVAAGDLGFPSIPGVKTSDRVHKAYRADYGPDFVEQGVVTQEPPLIGRAFPTLVPAVDADGNETPGVRVPELQAPLATYTGWNLFNAKSGPTHEISSMVGSYIPFPRTLAEREARNDPRPAIMERYTGRDEYLGLVAQAGLGLIEDGLMLPRDLPSVIANAARHWDYLMKDIDAVPASR